MNQIKQNEPHKSRPREWIEAFVLALALVVAFNLFFSNSQVYSHSMEPTFSEGDYVFISKYAPIERGSIVIFMTDQQLTEGEQQRLSFIQRIRSLFWKNKNLVKRVIGLPGETIEIGGGLVKIDGHVLEELYVRDGTEGKFTLEIPPEHYVLLGDNRQHSMDSRNPAIGAVDEKDIIGKVIIRYWPISKMQYF